MPIVFPAPLPQETAKSGDSERRAQVRFPFSAAAEVDEPRSKARVTGRCSDLGRGGCYIDTLSPFPVGAPVRVRMERENRKFEAEAVVTYAQIQMGMGLAFTGIKREHQEVLLSWIADLSGERAPESPASNVEAEVEVEDANANMRLVVNELITLLVRRKIITDSEGARLLRQMFR